MSIVETVFLNFGNLHLFDNDLFWGINNALSYLTKTIQKNFNRYFDPKYFFIILVILILNNSAVNTFIHFQELSESLHSGWMDALPVLC